MSSGSTSVPLDVLKAGREEYVTILVTTFAFGIYVVIVAFSMGFLLRDAREMTSRGRRIVLGYTWIMLILTCAWYYCVARNLGDRLVEQPHIVLGNKGQRFWLPANIVQNALAAVQFLSSDGLMVYRVYIICNRRWKLVALPLVIYVAYFGVSILINLTSLGIQFGGKLPLPPIHSTATALYTLGAAQNVVCMALIGARLLGTPLAHTSVGMTAVAILAESAAFLALCSLVFVILFRTGSPAQSWWGAVTNCSAFLSQSWIILRVSMRHGHAGGRPETNVPRSNFTTDVQLPSRISGQQLSYELNDILVPEGYHDTKRLDQA